MFTILRFFISFTLSFLILSIPIGNHHLFGVIHTVTSPYTESIYEGTIEATQSGFEKTRGMAQKVFNNSSPDPATSEVDRVQSTSAAVSKTGKKMKEEVESIIKNQRETITAEEEEKLRRVLMQSL